MLKSLLLPVETPGLYFQDYSVLNAECLHISFAGKPIWGSSKTEKLKGFPNKSALLKKNNHPNPHHAPKSKQPLWGKTMPWSRRTVLLSEIHLCSLPLVGSPRTQLCGRRHRFTPEFELTASKLRKLLGKFFSLFFQHKEIYLLRDVVTCSQPCFPSVPCI